MRRYRRLSQHRRSRWLVSPLATLLGALAFAVLLAGCAEKPQDADPRQAGSTVTRDTKPWNAEMTPHTAPGAARGDKEAWDDAMKRRTQGQNEYVRIGAQR